MRKFVILGVFILFVASCRKKPREIIVPNMPPETHLFIEGTTDTTGARQTICWYGNDPDGEVVGFYIAVDDTTEKFYTEATCSTFVFPSAQHPIVHTVYAWAVDNEGAVDPTPAMLVIPVINTPPVVTFLENSLPPDTTFPVASFYWEGHDEDGDETIVGYFYWLDTDEDSFANFVPPESTSVTLRNIEAGTRIFHVKAQDEAGALSPTLADTFYVMEVCGSLLLVDDEIGDSAGEFYRHFLDSLGILYSIWHVENGLPYSPQDIYAIINELGFNTIFWYTGEVSHFSGVQGALIPYLDSGKKLLLISKSILDVPLSGFNKDYLHVAEITQPDKFLIPSWPLITEVQGYPDTLILEAPILPHLDGFEPDSMSIGLYHFPEGVWGGAYCSLRYPVEGEAQVIFLAFPLHLMNGNNNAYSVLYKIFFEEF